MKDSLFRIRTARPEDDAPLGELLVRTFVETYSQKMPEVVVSERRKKELRNVEERRQHGTVLVGEEGNALVATVTLFRFGRKGAEAWSPDAASLRMMVIDSQCHGKQYSRQLIEHCVEIAEEWKCRAIELHVRRGAEGLARMYENSGFVRTPEGDLDLLPEVYLLGYRKEIAAR